MSLLSDIAAAYRGPRQQMAHQVMLISEPRTLMLGFTGCLLIYVSRMPALAVISHQMQDDVTTMSARFATMFVSSVIMAPLFLYLLAAVSHLALRVVGGQGSWQQARLALMWPVLVASPLMLLTGAGKVFAPAGVFHVLTVLTGVVFCWQWAACLMVVEFPRIAKTRPDY